MARSRNNSFKNLSKKLEDIQQEIQKTNEEIGKIANLGLQVAKATINTNKSKGDFTQAHKDTLSAYIRLVAKSNNEYFIIAQGDDQKINYELYFAEYGAGIGSSPQRALKATSGYTAKYVHKDGYWFYEDLYGKHHKVNTSIALGYMENARQEMKEKLKQLSKRTKTKIRTTIKRNR